MCRSSSGGSSIGSRALTRCVRTTGPRDVSLRGVADRIDLLKDGTFRVIDYKSSRAVRRSAAGDLRDRGEAAPGRISRPRLGAGRGRLRGVSRGPARQEARARQRGERESARGTGTPRRQLSRRDRARRVSAAPGAPQSLRDVRLGRCLPERVCRSGSRTIPSLPFDEPPLDGASSAASEGAARGRARRRRRSRGGRRSSPQRRARGLRRHRARRACWSIATSISSAPASSRGTSSRSRSRARPHRRCAIASSRRCGAPRTRAASSRRPGASLRDHLQDVAISTIDAFCLSLLREFPLEADLDPGFGMADETEALRLVDESLDRTLRICRARRAHRSVDRARPRPAGRVAAARGPSRPDRSAARRRRGARRAPSRPIPDAPHAGARGAELHRTASRHAGRAAERLHRQRAASRASISGPRDRSAPPPRVGEPMDDEQAFRMARLLMDGLREYFLTREGTPRKRSAYLKDDFPDERARRAHLELATALAPGIVDDIGAFRRDVNAVLTRGVCERVRHRHERSIGARSISTRSWTFPKRWRAPSISSARWASSRKAAFCSNRAITTCWSTSFRTRATRSGGWSGSSCSRGARDEAWPTTCRSSRRSSWSATASSRSTAFAMPTSACCSARPVTSQSSVPDRTTSAAPSVEASAPFRRCSRSPTRCSTRSRSFRTAPTRSPTRTRIGFQWSDRGDAAVSRRSGSSPRPIATRARRRSPPRSRGSSSTERFGIARLASRGRPRPGDFGILFRTREGHQEFERALEARGIRSYVYKGLGFFDADEIKDVIALLRYLADPSSDLRAAAFLRSRFVRLSDRALAILSPRLAQRRFSTRRWTLSALDADDRAVLARVRAVGPAWVALADRVPPAELLDRSAGGIRLLLGAHRSPRRSGAGKPEEDPRRRAAHSESRIRHAGARDRSPRSAVGRRRVECGDRRGGRRQSDDGPRGQGPRIPDRLHRQSWKRGRRLASADSVLGACRRRAAWCRLAIFDPRPTRMPSPASAKKPRGCCTSP